ncbi:MAG: 50S ribosomal protein L37ae [Methanomicrobia archaeon]|nr:50S ribosomal protein L37ae [Methanomicrobia archaeon]HDM22851.1 50S ribosomal protein L37ae [Methanomicrobia archaeon]
MGSANRFGVKAGKGIRDRINDIEKNMRKRHKCPRCHTRNVRRVSTGIWECKKCGFKFAGGAYLPETDSGKIVKRTIKRVTESV